MRQELTKSLEQIFNGYSILFVGSGFSAYAQNEDHEPLPTGGKLLSLLKERLKISSDYLSCTRFRRHQVRCFMEQEVRHGEKAVYAGVQA